jgi:hypothetical protein
LPSCHAALAGPGQERASLCARAAQPVGTFAAVEMALPFVVGISVGILLAFLLPWTRRIRTESGLDPELEAKALLGEDPPDFEEPPPPPDRDRDFDPGELRALRDIGAPEPAPRRRRARRRR